MMNEHGAPRGAGGPVADGAEKRAKVFVSYSRKDVAFAEMLVIELGRRGFDAFLDRTDIAPGEPWQERLAALIAAADTVVFVVSPDSVASSVCAWEIEESARLGKRLIPIVARPISGDEVPPALARLNWVFCVDEDTRHAALDALDAALTTDLAWVREHTRLGELAGRWLGGGRARAAALRGADLDAAERWLDRQPADASAPTGPHRDFIRASRHAATTRQRAWVGGAIAVALVALALAAFAEVNRRDARTQRDRAERALDKAVEASNTLVFEMTQRLRDLRGVPASLVKAILDPALKLQDDLVASGETSVALRRSQAAALDEAASTLLTLGDAAGAEAAAEKARDIMAAIVAAQPDEPLWRHDLSVCWNSLGDIALARGDIAGARQSYLAGLAIMDKLVAADPGNENWQGDLAVGYDKIGAAELATQRLDDALGHYNAALAIRQCLARAKPADAKRRRDLAVSFGLVGDVLLAQNHAPEALRSYETDLAISTELAAADPTNSDRRNDVAVANEKVGDARMRQRDIAGALASYQVCVKARLELTGSDPGNLVWQNFLAACHVKAGDAQAALAARADALASYSAALAIRRKLTQANPANMVWQRLLSVACNRTGDVYYDQGAYAQAQPLFAEGLAAMHTAARAVPGDSGWQSDLATSYAKLGSAYAKLGQVPEALAAWAAGRAVIAGLLAQRPDDATMKGNLAWFDQRMAELKR